MLQPDIAIVTVCAVASLGTNCANYAMQVKQMLGNSTERDTTMLNKAGFAIVLALAFNGTATSEEAFASQTLPFIGEKVFNFYGGPTGDEIIKIGKDGATKITAYGGTSGDTAIVYKGKYTNPLRLKNGKGYLIKDNKIYLLDNVNKRHIEHDCMGNGQPCVSELRQVPKI